MLRSYRKLGKRILSIILVIAMSISMLSGCGQSNAVDNGNKLDDTARKELEQNVQSASGVLAKQTKEIEDVIEELSSAITKEDDSSANSLVEDLTELLTTNEENTDTWLANQEGMTKGLSKEAATTFAERSEEFEEEIETNEADAQDTLTKLSDALSEGDMDTATSELEKLEGLLVEKKESKTYGEALPNDVEIQEAETEEYTETTDSIEEAQTEEIVKEKKSEKKATLSSEDNLLVTKEDTELNDHIIEEADRLGTPLAIYNYLKNSIGYEYYYGSRKGAIGTIDAMGGNDVDQASLCIAMLRHLGYPAEYVKGDILLTKEQALSLTGADTFRNAANILVANGTPVTCLTNGEEIVYIRMEHVWVRACIPYTDYRGAGNTEGESVWIDLDTSIKEYEQVDNIYDMLEEQGLNEEAELVSTDMDVAEIDSLLKEWEEKLESQDLSETYARKRIIKKQEVSYLPLSLQYTVENESSTFAHIANSDKDSISFEVNGEALAGFNSSELQGKDIILSFKPASLVDQEIYDNYSSVFDIPAYSVYMIPVLMVDGEIVAEGEEYLESTLGTKGKFKINISSGGKSSSVTNDITTGSMYAVTLDSQSITAEELQSVYDEATALKDTVTEDNVYSEEYLGKLLSLAGKLYFAQVDVSDTMMSDIYDVSVTRRLSEGITGYEVQTSSIYGRVTSLSEGSLYIDIDMNAYGVVSNTGNKDSAKNYMLTAGMMASNYESVIWEEITGIESVSTMSILKMAYEENVDVLMLSKANYEEYKEYLNLDEEVLTSIDSAINSGKIVTVPVEEITIGEWTGSGYIVMDPETCAAEYMISGGLSGGVSSLEVNLAYMLEILLLVIDLCEITVLFCEAILMLVGLAAITGPLAIVAGMLMLVLSLVLLYFTISDYVNAIYQMSDYMSGNEAAGEQIVSDCNSLIFWNIASIAVLGIGSALRKPIGSIGNKIGKNIIDKVLGNGALDDIIKQGGSYSEAYKLINSLKKLGATEDLIKEIFEKGGLKGLKKYKLLLDNNVPSDVIASALKKSDSFANLSEESVTILKGYIDNIDEVLVLVDKYGDNFIKMYNKYGNTAVTAYTKYGNRATFAFKNHSDDALDWLKKNVGEGGSGNSWYKPDGSINYPPNNGAVPGTEVKTTLQPGKLLGRYGDPTATSHFLTEAGVNPNTLALPPNTNMENYHVYEVVREIPETTQSTIMDWAGSTGGGIQFDTSKPIQWYLDNGYLIER